MRILKASFLIIGMLLALGTLSWAATVGPTTTSTPISYTVTDWNSSLSFPQFNPSLGTLMDVVLTFYPSLETVITVTNESGDLSYGTANTKMYITVDTVASPGGGDLTTTNGSPPPLYIDPMEISMLSGNFNYTLSGGNSTTSGTLTSGGYGQDTYTSSAVLTDFTGVGTITLPAWTNVYTELSNTGGTSTETQTTSASLTGTVTYDYNPPSLTPEPATMALLGSALIGLGLLGRKRFAR